MADLAHLWGGDLSLTATGDLALADPAETGRQRVLRRLLTNEGDYLWHLSYGAGLPRRIGDTINAELLEGVVRRQTWLEPAVQQDPPPVVTVAPVLGGVTIHLSYVDATTGASASAGFTVER